MPSRNQWFGHAVIYQIYIRSFYDSNGDGVGDLPGILKKLDYLCGGSESLGIDAIWLTPFYQSPMADFGYDVSDHTSVDPLFGTLGDFKSLLAAAHQRGVKVFVDFIPNHTSAQHDWFTQSRSSRTNDKRDWYIWRDPAPGGGPPNNWLSAFGGSAWEPDETTGQYYLHSFLAGQPDLNWHNPKVRAAMHRIMRFWLDMGVDGLRVDAVEWLSKDTGLRDDPPNPDYRQDTDIAYHERIHLYSKRGPQLYVYLKDMAAVVAAYPGRFMITEVHTHKWSDAAAYLKFYDLVNPRVSAPFNMEGILSPWDAQSFRGFIDAFLASLGPGYVPVWCLGNHDSPRLVSRIGKDAARTAAVLLITLPGTAVIYYGDELGMPDGIVDGKDPLAGTMSRDPERTPIAWSGNITGGFTTGTPWLHVNPSTNADQQMADQESFLWLYKRLLRLRGRLPALRQGSYRSLAAGPYVFAYVREDAGQKIAILLNFSSASADVLDISLNGRILFSIFGTEGRFVAGQTILAPHDALVVECDAV